MAVQNLALKTVRRFLAEPRQVDLIALEGHSRQVRRIRIWVHADSSKVTVAAIQASSPTTGVLIDPLSYQP